MRHNLPLRTITVSVTDEDMQPNASVQVKEISYSPGSRETMTWM